MATDLALPVAPANALTARWIHAIGNHPTVSSGAAVWPLLAIVASAAAGTARDELAAAVGIDPDTGTPAGRALLDALTGADGVSAALGLWSRVELPIRPEFARTSSRPACTRNSPATSAPTRRCSTPGPGTGPTA